tara:strand:- start:159 stop:677 length:519 start_codon:yes stop_codon:yes gene_type:complete
VKKILIFIIFIFLSGCSGKKYLGSIESCPKVFFSKEDKIYIASNENEITFENIAYRAYINNFAFESKCYLEDNILSTTISLLFILEPNDDASIEVFLPYYIATINSNDELIDVDYYQALGKFRKDSDNLYFVETELTDTNAIKIKNIDSSSGKKNSLVIGFMLDDEKNTILN